MNSRKIAKALLRGTVDRHVVVGPATWQPSDGISARRWYFMVVTNRRDGPFIASVNLDAYADPEEGRTAVVMALLLSKPGRVVHNCMGTELEAAKLCAGLWPCERLERLARAVELEQQRCSA